MRGVIFRVLAGFLAVAFVGLVVAGRMPVSQRVWAVVMGAVFGLYAGFGSGPAEQLMELLVGDMTGGKRPPDRH